MKEKEREKSAKEELWKEEKRRRESADKAWDVSNSISQEEILKDDQKGQNVNSNVSLSKLEETILKVQQQMSEGSDHVNYEIKMKEQERKSQKKEQNVDKDTENSLKLVTHHEKIHINPSTSKSPSPKKIKIRVEMEKSHKKPEKIDKKVAANTVVSLMVPYFKKGQIASREVFKSCAKEFTSLMLDHKITNNPHDETIPLSRYTKYVDKFFSKSGNILTEGELKHKLAKFKASLEKH